MGRNIKDNTGLGFSVNWYRNFYGDMYWWKEITEGNQNYFLVLTNLEAAMETMLDLMMRSIIGFKMLREELKALDVLGESKHVWQ